MEIAKKIVIPDIAAGIHAKKAIDGGSLPDNEPATIRRKNKATSKRIFTQKGNIRAGVSKQIEKTGLTSFGSAKPLIETGKLVSSFIYKLSGKNKVIIRIKSNRNRIGGYLQNDGVKTKSGRKFYRFFGISEKASTRAIAYAIKKIKELKSGHR